MAEDFFCDCGRVARADLPPGWGILAPNRDEFEPYVTRDFPATKDAVTCQACGKAIRVRWPEQE